MSNIKIGLRAARVDIGLTLEEAAIELSISEKSLRRYETFKSSPDYPTVLKMSFLYGIPIQNLRLTKSEGSENDDG